jgi:hypothetical protein
MLRLAFLTFLFPLLGSCGIGIKSPVSIVLNEEQLLLAEYHKNNTYYTFEIASGPLKAYLFQLHLVNGGKAGIQAQLVHPEKLTACVPEKRRSWRVREKINLPQEEANISGSVVLSCGGNATYRLAFSFKGKISPKEPIQIH